MKEYATEALILAKEDLGEADMLVTLYCRDHGKITAKVKSSKKITSKLNGHLEPFTLAQVRIINKGPQIVDALVIKNFAPSWPLHAFLNFIKEITFEGQADNYFWLLVEKALATERYDYRQLLTAQGFDPKFALCQNCQRPRPEYFFFQDHNFWCVDCIINQADNQTEACLSGFIALS